MKQHIHIFLILCLGMVIGIIIMCFLTEEKTKLVEVEKIKISEYDLLYRKLNIIFQQDGDICPLYISTVISNVIKYSYQAGFDPELILSIIYVESYFNLYEYNSCGASGLMQIISSNPKRFEIEYNIKTGIQIFKDKFNQYGNTSMSMALLKYNGAIIHNYPSKKVTMISTESLKYIQKVFNIYYRFKGIG